MKKITKTGELMWILGVIFVALGVAICSKTNLGVSMIAAPAFILSEFCNLYFGISVGVIEYIFQGILLIILCIIIRKFRWKFLLAFLVAVIYGYTLDLFIWLLSSFEFNEVWLRWVMLIVGDVITALGVATFFKTYLPLQVYELFVSEISNIKKWDLRKVKLGFDMSLLVISITLALVLFMDIGEFDFLSFYYASFHSIGLGTIVTTIINAPIIAFWLKCLNKVFEPTPIFEKLYNILK